MHGQNSNLGKKNDSAENIGIDVFWRPDYEFGIQIRVGFHTSSFTSSHDISMVCLEMYLLMVSNFRSRFKKQKKNVDFKTFSHNRQFPFPGRTSMQNSVTGRSLPHFFRDFRLQFRN